MRPDHPDAITDVPSCPAWLAPAAKAVWNSTVKQLGGLGVLAKVDQNMLARYCDGFARWRQAQAKLDEATDQDGIAYQMAFARYNKLGQMLLRMEQELGLTPAARTRLPAGAKSDEPKSPATLKLVPQRRDARVA